MTDDNDGMVREEFINMVKDVKGILNKGINAEVIDVFFDFAFSVASEIKSNDCGEFLYLASKTCETLSGMACAVKADEHWAHFASSDIQRSSLFY